MHDGKLLEPGVGTTLLAVLSDPKQLRPFRDEAIERRILAGITAEMRGHDAPAELFERYGIEVALAA